MTGRRHAALSTNAAWWDETLRRCDEAEQNPAMLLDADTFFRDVREEIALAENIPPRS